MMNNHLRNSVAANGGPAANRSGFTGAGTTNNTVIVPYPASGQTSQNLMVVMNSAGGGKNQNQLVLP